VNPGLPEKAGNAIMTTLGSSERTTAEGDRFLVPVTFTATAGVISSAGDGRADLYAQLGNLTASILKKEQMM